MNVEHFMVMELDNLFNGHDKIKLILLI